MVTMTTILQIGHRHHRFLLLLLLHLLPLDPFRLLLLPKTLCFACLHYLSHFVHCCCCCCCYSYWLSQFHHHTLVHLWFVGKPLRILLPLLRLRLEPTGGKERETKRKEDRRNHEIDFLFLVEITDVYQKCFK